jgi:3-phosphoshikimate 1-carboxyvinyltransferase
VGKIEIPRSKSISNRALIIAELAGKGTHIAELSEADDTRLLKKHLTFIRSWGASGIPTIFDVENAGTVARFLTAYLVSHVGEWLVTGCRRMKERPIGSLVEGLTKLGAKISYRGNEGFLPIHISGNDINGGELNVDTTMSSQFVTAILLIGPYLEDGLKINFSDEVVSKPYINMTVEMMKSFGAHVSLFDKYVVVEPHPYKSINYVVEADWSSAAFWYETAALSAKANVTISGLKQHSIQGDQVLPELFEALGVRTIFEEKGIRLESTGKIKKHVSFDFLASPDLAMPVITTCAALGIKSEFTGVGHLKYKESDRLENLRTELEKIGALLSVGEDRCSLSFSEKVIDQPIDFDTYHDHRLAMSLAPLILRFPKIRILDADVVGKSYPGFWTELKKLGFARLSETKTA